MRIKILLTVFIFSLSSFLSIRQSENTLLWNEIQNNDYDIQSSYYINASNTDKNIQKFYTILIKYADEFDLTIRLVRGDTQTGNFDAYYYNADNEFSLDLPLLNETESINFSQLNENQFYSTKTEADSSGYLFTYFPYNISKYTINNFTNVVSNKVRLTGEVDIFGDNDAIEALIREINLELGEGTMFKQEVLVSNDKEIILIDYMIVVSILLLFMIYLHEISRKAKEISLRLIQGQSFLSVCIKLCKPIFIKSIGYYLLCNLLLYIVIIGTFNMFNFSFLIQILKGLGVLVLMIFLVLMFGILILSFIPKHSIIKNKSFNKSLYRISSLIKVCLIVSLLPNGYFITQDMVSNFQTHSQLKVNRENSKYLTERAQVFFHSDMPSQETHDSIMAIASDLLMEFENSYLSVRYVTEFENIPYTFISIEYSFYERFLKGSMPDISPNDVTAVVRNVKAPVPYHVSIEDNFKLLELAYDYQVPFVGGHSSPVKNPILVIYPDREVFIKNHKNYEVKNISYDKEESINIRNHLNEIFSDKLSFGGHEDRVRLELMMVEDTLRENIIQFGQLFLTLIFVIILGNMTLISTRESESAIMLSLGYSSFRRRIIFLSSHILIFIFCFYYLMVKNVPIGDSLLLSGLVIFLDYLVISYILFLQKFKVVRVIKRG